MIIYFNYEPGRQASGTSLQYWFGHQYALSDDDIEPHWTIHWKMSDSFNGARAEVQYINASSELSTMNTWIAENCTHGYSTHYRFNSGNPYLSIILYSPDDVTAFKLRWDNRHESV